MNHNKYRLNHPAFSGCAAAQDGRKAGICRTIYLITVILAGVCILGGCKNTAKDNAGVSKMEESEVIIPVIFTVDPATDQKSNEQLVENFNQKFKGTYRMEVEWMVNTVSEYRSRIKMLNVTDELPAVLTDVRFLPSYYQFMVNDKRLMNLAPYIKNDKEWVDSIEPQVLDSCTEEDGSIYLSTIGTASFSGTGIFWNKKLFAEAGITKFPETWEEFWSCCEQLSENGITPLSLHTDGTAWAPMLLVTARLGDTAEGVSFMRTELPESYNNKYGRLIADTLCRLFKYTTEDAVNQDFDVAYQHFSNGETAMIPNGFWMLDQLSAEMQKNIGFSPFPENVMITSPEMSGWVIADNYPEDVKQGALEFLKFRTIQGVRQKQELMNQKEPRAGRTLMEYISALKNNPVIIPNYQIQWNSILQDEVFTERIPELVNGRINGKKFIGYMDDSISKYQNEN